LAKPFRDTDPLAVDTSSNISLANGADGALFCDDDLVVYVGHGSWASRKRDLVAVFMPGVGDAGQSLSFQREDSG
jgi:hypothetical protein